MAVQNLVLVSDDKLPLEGLVEQLKGANPDMAVFRTGCLEDFLEVTRHLKAEVLVADLDMRDFRKESLEEKNFRPTRGNARGDMAFVKRYIRRHCDEDLSLTRLSKMTAITVNYLCSIFKSQTGESLTSYITRIRMEKAALLLVIHPEVMIRDIAARVGYPNKSYFDRVFRSYYGLAPRDYRRKYTEGSIDFLGEAED